MRKLITSIIALVMVAGAAIAYPEAAVAHPKVVRLLAIGNSFSEDSIEQNLSEIALEKGTPMIIANMYIGGCSIDRHLKNVKGDIHDYRYTKIDAEGNKTITKGVALSEVIAEEPWDYISIQQKSGTSGQIESYKNMAGLVDWIHANAPQAEIVFHQTWAYSADSNHRDYGKYNRNQLTMYNAICSAVQQACKAVGIKTIIPTGQALQILREQTGNYDYTRDGYHLSKGVGRYLASLVWYQTIMKKSIAKVKYRPDGSDPRTEPVTKEQASQARKAAGKARKYSKLN